MACIDENQEAIACIRMDVDAADAKLKAKEDQEDIEDNTRIHLEKQATPQDHWRFGSPEKKTTTIQVETAFKTIPAFVGFQRKLFTYLQQALGEKIRGTPLKVCYL